MSQLNYDQFPLTAVLGMLADPGHNDIVSAENLSTLTFDVAVTAVQNATAYTIQFPLTAPVNATFTSANPDTQAGIVAGLVAAVNALAGASAVPYTASAPNPQGPILLKAKVGGTTLVPVIVTTGNLSIVADAGLIPYGTMVVMDLPAGVLTGITGRKCRLPQVAGDIGGLTLGAALNTQFLEQPFLPAPGGTPFDQAPAVVPSYPLQSSVNVLRQGRIWLAPETTVGAGDPIFVRFATGTGAQKGACRNNSDAGTCVQLPGAKWLDAAAGSALYGTGALSRAQLTLL